MESFAFNHIKQLARGSSDFNFLKDRLIDLLYLREPGSSFDFTDPYMYINSPLQDIKISDITGSDNIQDRANMQVENIKRGVPGGHGAALGRQIYLPIAVKMTSVGTYDIIDGFHRPIQALMNGDKTILAFVVGGDKGLTLQDIFNLSRESKS